METFDYNNPAKKEDFEILTHSDNGHCRKTGFKYNGNYYEHVYNYTKSYAFGFVYSYPSEYALTHSLSSTGSKIIYSSTLEADCTPLGKFIEYSLLKSGTLKTRP